MHGDLPDLLVEETVEEVDAEQDADADQSRDESGGVDVARKDQLRKPNHPLVKKINVQLNSYCYMLCELKK